MALALCLTLLPATAQAAEEDTHTHCLCGKSGCTEADRVEIAFSKWLTSDREQTSNSWRLDCGNVGDTTGIGWTQKTVMVIGFWKMVAII